MNIALVLDRCDARRGGLEQWMAELAPRLSNAGRECHVAVFESLSSEVDCAKDVHGRDRTDSAYHP